MIQISLVPDFQDQFHHPDQSTLANAPSIADVLPGRGISRGSKDIFVVGTFRKPLAKVYMAMLWSLCAEVLTPSEHENLSHLMQDTVSFFKFPSI